MTANDDAGSGRAGGSRFATTHWSVVLEARESENPRAREALATLCKIYWYPLYAFIRRRGSSPDDAEDRTQAFFTHLLEKESLRHVDPAKGRFRSFLVASLKNFLADQRAIETAKKRGGGVAPISLDAAAAEDRYALDPAHEVTPERLFETQWALTVIEQALIRLRERYARTGKETQFDLLKVFLSGEKRPVPHAVVARRLGISEVAVKVAVHRLRKRFRDALREEIAQTVDGEESIDAELRALYAALDSAGGM
jgi:RNA polymerase sigma-70 factor (ECF subfamily)